MKSLQKYFCTIFLFFSIIIAGCKPNISNSANDSVTISASFTVTDANGKDCPVIHDGTTTHSVTIKTNTATLNVTTQPFNAQVSIGGVTSLKLKKLTYAENQVPVTITYNGVTQNHTLNIRWDRGLIQSVTVKDDNGHSVSARSSDNTDYSASIGMKNAKVVVKTIDAKDSITIEEGSKKATGVGEATADVEFGTDEVLKTLTVKVKHQTEEKSYTVKIFYSDPNNIPQEAVLTDLTVTNVDNGQTLPLSPVFKAYNDSYTVIVPASVSKVKVEPSTANSEITATVDGGAEHMLNEGANTITVTVAQKKMPTNKYQYTRTVHRARAGASSNAELGALAMDTKWVTMHKDWIKAPDPFNKATYVYTGEMDGNCDEFYIKAKPDDVNAVMTVTANGNLPVTLAADMETKFTPLKNGLNTFVITVTAQDGVSTKNYTINATRNNGSYLLKKFSGTDLTPFYAGAFEGYKNKTLSAKFFEATVKPSVTSTTITAEAEYPGTTTMTIKVNRGSEEPFDGSRVVDLTKEDPKNPGWVRIEITLTSKTIKANGDTYILDIKKASPTGDSENSLKDLTVSYYDKSAYRFIAINPTETFTPTKTDYTVTLPYGVTEIRVRADPKSAKAYIDGWIGSLINSFDILRSPTTVEIPVTAENGDRKVYKITVTQLESATIAINSITSGQQINITEYSDGLTVTGTFTDPTGSSVYDIWVGSSGLPIQQKKGGKWIKAAITGTTFKAVIPQDILKELPNGHRDIKAAAFDIRGANLATHAVPVVITGNSVAVAPVLVKIDNRVEVKNGAGEVLRTETLSIPANATVSIYALDEEAWGKGEDVVFASKIIAPISDTQFPMRVPLVGITAGRECRVEVYIYEKVLGKDSLLYSGVGKVLVQAGQQNLCELTLMNAQ